MSICARRHQTVLSAPAHGAARATGRRVARRREVTQYESDSRRERLEVSAVRYPTSRAAQPAPAADVLSPPSGLTTATGMPVTAAQVRGERLSSSGPLRLHRHQRHGLRLTKQPGVERGEARSVLADPRISGRPGPGPSRQRVATYARPPMSIPIVVIRPASFGGPHRVPGSASGRRQLTYPITGQSRRIPITVHGRGSGAGR